MKNNSEIKIKNIRKKDLTTLAYIFADAYKAENTGEHWTPESALKVVKYWHKRAPKDLQVLSILNGEIIGAFFADVKPWWNGNRMIDGEFFVLTNKQKLGAGKKMLLELTNIAKDKYKCNCFETITFTPTDKHPLKWYEQIGFHIEDSLVVIKADLNNLSKTLKED